MPVKMTQGCRGLRFTFRSRAGCCDYRLHDAGWQVRGELSQPSLEKAPLRLLAREAERPLVGHSSIRGPPQAPTQVRPSGVRQVIIVQVAAREEGIDDREARRRAVPH